ncbi:BTAD domain-containing putative transcriptional regulator [Promicromonospora sp. NPDC059942]|uniref:AfsR/SARP family transcriptional regulator n=1 Tax=Promicromonospora sp. NPDC059942 TaxID=3347009 RepID=UPI00365AD650
MRVNVLGTVEVSDGVTWAPVSAARCRGVLGTIIAHSPQAVPVAGIVHDVWGPTPPASAAAQAYTQVRKIRLLLDDPKGDALRLSDSGYSLNEDLVGVDARVFEAATHDGRHAFEAGAFEQSLELLDAGLALWRGEPFDGSPPGDRAVELAHRLTNLRTTALEDSFQARINLGRHRGVVSDIEGQIAEHPFREQLWRQLLTALYRSGRIGEALQQYDRLRRSFADELGTDPSPATRVLHEQILHESLPGPTAAAPVRTPAPSLPPPAPAPRQLPPGLPDFCGREVEVHALAGYLLPEEEQDQPTVVVVHGAPGTGKSSLALHAARMVRDRYPDAHFRLDLAGASGNPRLPDELLATMLQSITGLGHILPTSPDDRAALLRSLLAGRRVLLLLDDAASTNQILPLLPPNGQSAVVVTSRGMLAELPGARRIHLDTLTASDAELLLAQIVGKDRIDAERDEAQAIVHLCGLLPLSIRIVGAKLLSRPSWPLQRLRERLDDETKRLSELRIGDLDVVASLDLSRQSLSDHAATAFDLFGLLGPCEAPAWVFGALLDTTEYDHVIDELTDAGLLQQADREVGQIRYHMHDLLRDYARLRARERRPDVCRNAVARVLDGWILLADGVWRDRPHSFFDPPDRSRDTAIIVPSWLRDDEGSASAGTDGMRWIAVERQNLLEAVRLACHQELTTRAYELASVLAPLYDEYALYDDWHESHLTALASADISPLAASTLQRGLSQVHIYKGDIDTAAEYLEASRRTCQEHGNAVGAALAQAGMATVSRCRGQYHDSETKLRDALTVVSASGDLPKELVLRNGLGRLLVLQGRTGEARPWLTDTIARARHIDDTHREAAVLRELSALELTDGHADLALTRLEEAAQIFEKLHDERCAAATLLQMGPVLVALADHERAIASLTDAADFYHRHGLWDDEQRSRALIDDLARSGAAPRPDATDPGAQRTHAR